MPEDRASQAKTPQAPATKPSSFLDANFISGLANELYSGTPGRREVLGSSQDAQLTSWSDPAALPTQAEPSWKREEPEPRWSLDPHTAAGVPMGGAEQDLLGDGGVSQRPGPGLAQPRFYFLREETSAAAPPVPVPSFDVQAVRRDFPALHQKVNGRPLVWLDNAATSQKPQSVIAAVSRFYERDNSNVHRAAHALAARATDAYEGARRRVQLCLGARLLEEVVFVRGTTEGINLVAQAYGRTHVGPGDEIVVTELEHHANIVPWQMLAQEKGAVLRVVPITDAGEVMLEAYEKLLGPRTRLVALSHASNVLGTVLPVELMTRMAHGHGARVLIDGAQAVPHFRVNVQAIGCDFYVFSGHKVFGPTGIGALYGKAELLNAMPPWQGGGNMIDTVSFEHTTYNEIPHKFEAGTGNLADAVGLGAAIDYLRQLGFEAASHYEHALLHYATRALATVDGLHLIGTAPHKVGVLSFILEGTRPEDVASFLDREGIAVRAGHHCAQPTMRRYGLEGTVRASLAFYNTREEIDVLVAALRRCQRRLFKHAKLYLQ